MSLEIICSSVLAIWLNFRDRWWRQCGDVEDSHHLPCNLPIHWNVTNASSITANIIICLLLLWISVIYFRHLHTRFFIFLSHFFWIHGHPPHIRNIISFECPTEYLAAQQVEFVPEKSICISEIFLLDILPRYVVLWNQWSCDTQSPN